MRKSLTFGRFLGIPLRIHINWFLIATLVTWSLAVGYFPQEHPGWSPGIYWIVGSVTSFLFFVSVLFHELGHALLAMREGVPVNSITLFIFGGIAHIGHEPETADSEFRIVIAGPLASLSLAVFFHFFGRVMSFSPEVSSAAGYLSQINLLLAVFNLLPGFPLDGGRVLRSLFWKWKDDYQRATRWATHTGFALAVFFILTGIVLMVWGSYFNGLWVAIIGWYLSTASISSYRQTFVEEVEGDSNLETATQKRPETIGQGWELHARLENIEPSKSIKLRSPGVVMRTALPIPEPAKPPFMVHRATSRSRLLSGEVEAERGQAPELDDNSFVMRRLQEEK